MRHRGQNKNKRGASSRGQGGCRSNAATTCKPSQTKTPESKSPKKPSPKKVFRPRDVRPLRERFGRGDTMNSAQRLTDQERQIANYLSHTEFCRAPPMGLDLVQMRLVIPGDHLAPKALGDLRALDDVRRDHEVWITRAEDSETFLDISSTHTKSLCEALNAINWKIHGMRLSEESLTAQYFVQRPLDNQVLISFETGKRPITRGSENITEYAGHALGRLRAQMTQRLPAAVKALVALPCLKMQVNFGHLNIVAKRKTLEKLLPIEEFESALDSYSTRGRGAMLLTDLSNIEIADKFLSTIAEKGGIVNDESDIIMHHQVHFDVDKQTVSADLLGADGVAKATSAICTETESHPPLDMIISAPEMHIDWSLRVESRSSLIGDSSDQLSKDIAEFLQSFTFNIPGESRDSSAQPSKDADNTMQHFKLPKCQLSTRGKLSKISSNFKVKSCARVQFKDTPYEIETAITQHWAGIPSSAEPDRVSWSVSVYGVHWEEALSESNSGELSREFDEELHRLWPGEGSLEDRFEGFLECVLSVQTVITEQLC